MPLVPPALPHEELWPPQGASWAPGLLPMQDQATQQNCGWSCHLPWFQRWMAAHINDTQVHSACTLHMRCAV